MKPGPKRQTKEQALHNLFADAERTATGCLIPSKKPMPAGYIQVRYDGIPDYAHRLVYEFNKGKVATGLVVRHSCHNKACIELEHLVVGTHADNVQDKVNANRQPKGETHYRARLTKEAVAEIKNSTESYAELSRKYRISRGAIHNVKSGRTWKS